MGYNEDLQDFITQANKGSKVTVSDQSITFPSKVASFEALKSQPVPEPEKPKTIAPEQVGEYGGKPVYRLPPKDNVNTPTSPEVLRQMERNNDENTEWLNTAHYDNGKPVMLGALSGGVAVPFKGPGLEKTPFKSYNYLKWSMDPEEAKTGLVKNAPLSAAKLPGRLVTTMLYEYPKSIFDEWEAQAKLYSSDEFHQLSPEGQMMKRVEGGQKQLGNVVKPFEDVFYGIMKGSGVYDTVRDARSGKLIVMEKVPVDPKNMDANGNPKVGFKEKVVFSLPEFKEFKQMWNADPVGTAALFMPFLVHSLAKNVMFKTDDFKIRMEAEQTAAEALNRARAMRQEGQNPEKMEAQAIHTVIKSANEEWFGNGWDFGKSIEENLGGKEGEALQQEVPKVKAKRPRTKDLKKTGLNALTLDEIDGLKSLGYSLQEMKVLTPKDAREIIKNKTTNAMGSVKILNEEAPKSEPIDVSQLSNDDVDVTYDGEQEYLGHQITLVPKNMTLDEALKSGRASTIYAKDLADAKTKVAAKVAEYQKADEILNADVDAPTGLENAPKSTKRVRKPKPLENPEESDFFQDEIDTYEKTQVLKSMSEAKGPDYVSERPYLYLASLINEVNRWYHKHPGVDIDKIRNEITNLANRIDELKDDFRVDRPELDLPDDMESLDTTEGFDPTSAFQEFKTTVQQVSQWARRLQQKGVPSKTSGKIIGKSLKDSVKEIADENPELKDTKYGTVSDIKFYSGIPLDKIKEILHSADFKRFYHGSGQGFDKFDKNYMRTGEGHQAFGYGFYISDSKGIAKGYANSIGNKYYKSRSAWDGSAKTEEPYNRFHLDGQKFSPRSSDIAHELHRMLDDGLTKADVLSYIRGEMELTEHYIKEYTETRSEFGDKEVIKLKKELDDYAYDYNAIDIAKKIEEEPGINKPSLYTIRTRKHSRDMNWFDWKTAISDMSPKIKDALTKVGFKEVDGYWSNEKIWPTGLEIKHSNVFYEQLANALGGEAEASAYLANIGIDGIRYEAGTLSGGTKPGTKNYVVFDPENLVIERQTRNFNSSKLYSNPAAEKTFEKISEYFKAVRTAKTTNLDNTKEGAVRKWLNKQKRNWISQSANIKNDLMFLHPDTGGYEALHGLNLSISATSRSAAIADALKKDVLRGLSDLQKEALDEVVFAKRTRQIIDRDELMKAKSSKYKRHKNPLDLSRDDWQDYIDNIGKKGLSPEEVNEVYRRADMIFDISRDQLKQLRDEGIIDDATFEDLQHLDYQRRQIVDKIDPEIPGVHQIGNRKVSVRESGIQQLKVGKAGELLETDAIRLMEDLVVRTQNRIMMNRAAKDLYNVAKQNPDSPLVRLKQPDTWQIGNETIDLKGGSVKGWSPIHVFIDGKKETMYMPPEYANEWVTRNREVSYELARFGRLVSGSSIVRAMATGVNVGFAIKNVFRDFAYMWVASQHYVKGQGWTSTYSNFAPKAMGQMVSDIKDVWSDVFHKRGIYQDFVEQGGLLDFLSDKDRIMRERIGKDTDKRVVALQDALYWASNFSELLGRTSLYNRALKKGLPKREAAYLARDYLFFGDYGSFTKAVDTVVPYFGATIKATEGIWRAASRNKNEFALKATQAMTFGATLYLINQAVNSDAYSQLSSRDKEQNFIIPIPIPYKGVDGKDHFLYPKLPKDQGQAFFMALGEKSMEFITGKNTDSDMIVNTLRGLSPISEVPTVPSAEAVFSYVLNKDFWTYDDIWKGPEVGDGIFDRSAEINYTGKNRTNPVAVGVGQVTGLSPVKLSKALESIVPRNYLTDSFTSLTKMMFDNAPDEMKDASTAELLSKNSTLRGMLATTDDMNGVRDQMDQNQFEDNIKKVENNGKADLLIQAVYKDKTKTEADIDKFIDSIDDENEVKRIEERIDQGSQIINLPHYTLWRKLQGQSPEAAAKSFYYYMSGKSDAEKTKLLDELDTVDEAIGLSSERFEDEYDRLEQINGGKK